MCYYVNARYKKMMNYKDMPIRKNGKNEWYDNHIKILILDRDNRDKDVILLNQHNSYELEKDIKNNVNYNGALAELVFDYYVKVGKIIKKAKVPTTYKKALVDLIRMIDLENHTKVWDSKKDQIFLMVDFILDPKNSFWDRLEKGDKDLVDDLKDSAIKKKNSAGNEGPRSLASKVCKYFSEYFYDKDNYYINDAVVRHVVPYYYCYYVDKNKIIDVEKAKYKDLYDVLKEIHDKSCPSLKKSELDHIMWYSYRYGKDI